MTITLDQAREQAAAAIANAPPHIRAAGHLWYDIKELITNAILASHQPTAGEHLRNLDDNIKQAIAAGQAAIEGRGQRPPYDQATQPDTPQDLNRRRQTIAQVCHLINDEIHLDPHNTVAFAHDAAARVLETARLIPPRPDHHPV